jgi:hypothetical protein
MEECDFIIFRLGSAGSVLALCYGSSGGRAPETNRVT